MPAHVPNTGMPSSIRLFSGSNNSLVVEQLRHRRALAAGQDERVDAVEIGGVRTSGASTPSDCEPLLVGGERTLQCEHPDDRVTAARVGSVPGRGQLTSPDRRSAG